MNKKLKPKDYLIYLQERYRKFLEDHHVDVIYFTDEYFCVGSPSYEDNGTIWYQVYPLKTKIKIEYRVLDEGGNYTKSDEGILLETVSYKNIDVWMSANGYKKSSKKDYPKKNYRR